MRSGENKGYIISNFTQLRWTLPNWQVPGIKCRGGYVAHAGQKVASRCISHIHWIMTNVSSLQANKDSRPRCTPENLSLLKTGTFEVQIIGSPEV